MKAAYDSGVNFFDCAEGYAGGESEKVMGEAIKLFGWKRNDLVISTKVRVSHGRRQSSLLLSSNILKLTVWLLLPLLVPSFTGAVLSGLITSTTAASPASTSSRGWICLSSGCS